MRSLSADLDALLAGAGDLHGARLVMLCSFQKEESVLVESLLRVAPRTRLVTIDTGVLFPETLATWRAFEQRFGARIEVQDARGTWTGRTAAAATRRSPRSSAHWRAPAPGSPGSGASSLRRARARRRPSSTSAAGIWSTTRWRAGASRTSGT